jgi:hypothetical protein
MALAAAGSLAEERAGPGAAGLPRQKKPSARRYICHYLTAARQGECPSRDGGVDWGSVWDGAGRNPSQQAGVNQRATEERDKRNVDCLRGALAPNDECQLKRESRARHQ